jgi:DNA-binding transcriptional regulator GbsR (MarR family)
LNIKLKIEPEIYQKLIDFYGDLFNLSPLSAKIYAYFIFDFEKNGLTFDDLVDTFCASKSSVSASINYLLNSNLIKTINKIDERKRYFVINDDFVKMRFEEIANRMKQEIKILDQLNKFKAEQLADGNLSERYYIYKSLLEKNIDNIEDTLQKL